MRTYIQIEYEYIQGYRSLPRGGGIGGGWKGMDETFL